METKNKESKFIRFGTNYKLSDILGAVGVKQMEKINTIIDKRIELANYYNDLLAEVESIRPPKKRENTKHVYETYAAYVELDGARDELIEDLRKKNIETQIGTYALHLQPSYEGMKKIGKLERAEKLYRNLLALPMCHTMTKKDQEYVVSEIKSILKS